MRVDHIWVYLCEYLLQRLNSFEVSAEGTVRKSEKLDASAQAFGGAPSFVCALLLLASATPVCEDNDHHLMTERSMLE
jgi:hypothetical protein